MIKAVIFDVDGTLLDSVDLHARAWQEAFHDFGHDVEFSAIRSQIGKGGDQLMPEFLTQEQIKEIGERLEEHRSKLFKAKYLEQVVAFPQVRSLFEHIRQDGKRIALGSSAKGDELQTYKTIAGITDLLDAETSSDDANKSKPHPDIFQAALRKLNVKPSDAIVIGDTPYDAEAAVKAGVKAVGFTCGGWAESDLKKAGCIEIFRDPADLLKRYSASILATD